MEDFQRLDAFVKHIINSKASATCLKNMHYPIANVEKWLNLLQLDGLLVAQPVRLVYDMKKQNIALFNSSMKNILLNVSDAIRGLKHEIIVIPMAVGYGLTYHTNVVIVNTMKKTYERFEPYGEYRRKSEIIEEWGNTTIVTHKMDKAMDTYLEGDMRYYCNALKSFRFIKTIDFCPSLGLQSVAEAKIIKDVQRGKPLAEYKGFCTAWSMMYAHLRVIFPLLEPSDIINEIMRSVRKHKRFSWNMSEALEKFVQRYACLLESLVI